MSTLASTTNGVTSASGEVSKLAFGKAFFAFIAVGPLWLGLLQVPFDEFAGRYIVLTQVILILISAVMFTIEFRKANPRPLLLMIWLFNAAAFGIPGLSQILSSTYPWPLLVSDEEIFAAQLATIFSSLLLVFLIEMSSAEKAREVAVRRVDTFRLRNLTLFLVPALLYTFQLGGGLQAFFSSRGALSAAKSAAGLSKAQSGLFFTGTQSLTLLVCVCALILRKREKNNAVANIALFVSVSGLLIIANPLSASRFWFFTVVTTLALATITLTPGRIRFGAMSVFIGILFIFPLADYFRRENRTVGSVGSSAWQTGDFDTLQITSSAINWFYQNGSVWGHQLMGAIFPMVPRSIWPSKPYDTGILIARANGMKFENISGPWVGEAVINFGFFGVVLFPIAMAYGARIIRRRTEFFPDDFGVILGAFSVGYLPIVLRGSLIQASGAAGIFTLLALYLMPKVSSSKRLKSRLDVVPRQSAPTN